MFNRVKDAPDAQPVFAEARTHLDGHDPRDLAADRDADLHANATAQLLCCVQAAAYWAVLKPHLADTRLVVAGYSVGEVAAWHVAGALDIKTLFAVVACRAKLMNSASTRPGALLAVRGLADEAIDEICAHHHVYVAIRNAADRIILGGWSDDIGKAQSHAKSLGATATAIPVGVPSHTPLLERAATDFSAYLAHQDAVRAPVGRLLSGIDGAPVFDIKDGLAKLGRQVAQTVDWSACMDACRAANVSGVLELGPGSALATMMDDYRSEGRSRSVDEFRSIDALAGWIARRT